MILLADSGSTKCDWLIMNEDFTEADRALTMGFNPYFHSEAVISTAIKQNEKLSAIKEKVSHIYYYGAGCSSEELNGIVKRALRERFPNAEILVDHDLLGAAYSTYDGNPSITCILGTGSNSCYFDGENLISLTPGLGYILGDEGSGSFFGKKLITNYLYKSLPEEIYEDFKKRYELTEAIVVENVYVKPNANVYLASFVRYLSDWKDHPYIKKMLHEGMVEFITAHVLCFKEARDVEINVVGSVGYHFQESFKSALKQLGLKEGKFIQKPLDGLVNFHKSNIL